MSGEKNYKKKSAINDGKEYYFHPIYTNYGCSKDGYIINCKTLKPRKGRLQLNGYLQTAVYNHNGTKKWYSHRFIWESINQQIIPDGYQIHHINNDKQDNSIDNLELVTRQKNMLYANNERCGKKNQSPQNVSSNMSKTRASALSRVPNTEKQMKARGRRPSAFICFEVFGTRDKARSPSF